MIALCGYAVVLGGLALLLILAPLEDQSEEEETE